MQIYVLAHSLKRTSRRRGLSLFDLPHFVFEQGFEGLEISDRHLSGLGKETIRRFTEECRSSRCGLIVDINVNFTSPEERFFEEEIGHAKKMILMASKLGAGAVRICIGGQAITVQSIFRKRRGERPADGEKTSIGRPHAGSLAILQAETILMRFGHLFRKSMPARIRRLESKLKSAIAALREVIPLAAERGIHVGIENHWGVSGDPQNIMRIVREIDSPFLGTCPDMGNFPRGIEPLAGLETLAPCAIILHAKSYGFRQDGEEKSIDYGKCLSIFRRSGFDGPITVEYEGLSDDLEGCRLTRNLIRRYW
jgi:sugar phosphate isomerase/epimerase